jgi:hypothetical protein
VKARNWVLAASAIGVVLAMPNIVRQVPSAAANPEPEPEARSVRVEHEFITLTDPAVRGERPDRVVVPAQLYSAQPPGRPVASRKTLAQRARRAFLGDGRYRPEPFPGARQP